MDLTIALIAVFASVALLAGAATSWALSRNAAGRRRLFGEPVRPRPTGVLAGGMRVTDAPDPRFARMRRLIPRSPQAMSQLQRKLATAGIHGESAVLTYLAVEVGLAAAFGLLAYWFSVGTRLLFAVAAAAVGYLLPGAFVARRIARRRTQIENGLPDALDLLIVSIEAGLAMDQAILKCAEEIQVPYPALGQELLFVNVETRAGKPRVEALKNFARRVQVDDVRALVAMLVQTDRFGTSVAQALRTHADESRIKRRQRAEERAAKLSVKLVFPLVFCLLPAFFVVAVGPAVIKFIRFFQENPFTGAQ